MADEPLSLVIEEGLARLTLTRPDSGNAMNQAMIEAIAAAGETLARDGSVRAVLIDAQGKNFCVGGDIQAFASTAQPETFITALAHRLHEGLLHLIRLRAPVVVAVQGAAAGAGLSLAAAADVVIGARSSRYAMAYAGIGLTTDGGASWLLPRLIGLRRTQELALLGRRLTADEALDWGLITKVVDDETLPEEALGVARQLAEGPTFAFGGLKRLLGGAHTTPLAEQLDQEAALIGQAMATADAQGAVKAFLARIPPTFTGG